MSSIRRKVGCSVNFSRLAISCAGQVHRNTSEMSIDELRECVPETQFEGADGYPFVIVLDHHIPQPWRMRFEAASMLSTRLREGSYASDWRHFLRLWVREMEHLAAHREGRSND